MVTGSVKQLVVSGFHRSGTSATMQALVRAGLPAGDEMMDAAPSNPDGHFEDWAFVRLHEEILSHAGRQWHDTGGELARIPTGYRARAADLIRLRDRQHRLWGFKDPRTSLLLNWWNELLPTAGHIVVYRDYLSCAQSLRHRQVQSLVLNPDVVGDELVFWRNPLHALLLWQDYNQALLTFVRNHRSRCLVISHSALLKGFDLVSSVNSKFGTDLDAQADTGINAHYQHAAPDQPIDFEIPPLLQKSLDQTMMQLNHVATGPACQLPRISHMPTTNTDTDHETEIRQRVTTLGIPTDQQMPETESARDREPISVCQIRENIRQKPDDIGTLLRAGHSYLALDNLQAAHAVFAQAQQLAPDRPAPLAQLGMLAMRQQQPRRATTYYRQALSLDSSNVQLWVGLVRALKEAGQFDKALTTCNTARQQITPNAPFLQAEADLYFTCEVFEKVIDVHDEAARSGNVTDPLIQLRTKALHRLGRTEQAMRSFYELRLRKLKSRPDYCQRLIQELRRLDDNTKLAFYHRMVHELDQLAARTSEDDVRQAA